MLYIFSHTNLFHGNKYVRHFDQILADLEKENYLGLFVTSLLNAPGMSGCFSPMMHGQPTSLIGGRPVILPILQSLRGLTKSIGPV